MIVMLASCPLATAADKPAKTELKPIEITLYPAAEPQPALKYQLLPPLLDRRPGNAAVWWNRIPAERNAFFANFYEEFAPPGKIDTWMKIPLDDPREKEYREKELAKVISLLRRSEAYSDMERAARFESCDWQLPIHEGNVITMLLPEVQQSRMYARLLSAKARLEIAEGKYDQAVHTLQTGYAEARHVGQGPVIISALVGVTIASMMNERVQELIQRPDSPNLYWALSTLPKPLVDFRPGFEAESNLLYLQFPELQNLDKKKLSPDEWNHLYKCFWNLCRKLDPEKAVPEPLEQYYSVARKFLTKQGRSPVEIDAMPATQVVLLYWVQRFQTLSDDQFKWGLMPIHEVGNQLKQIEKQDRSLAAERPLGALISAVAAAKEAEVRGQWTLARLRVLEALRLYAATHDGRWPDRLSDIAAVPVPKNPYDDKPFVYHRDGDRATLTSENGPKGDPWQYDITLKSKGK
ncbi:MAG: hypothetical protein ABFC77_05635 [Thermoguttaceae bacterium]